MKNYVTFGQIHTHAVNGKTLDKDCVAVFDSLDAESGRRKAFELFGGKFSFHYVEDEFDQSKMFFFPRGLISVDGGERCLTT